MTSAPVYRALDLLTRHGYAPKVKRLEPYWRPKSPKVAKDVHTPAWSWESVTKTAPGNELVDLDVNAAFLAAISSANFAHNELTHTGDTSVLRASLGTLGRLEPGYYLISAPPWNGRGICSPLGTAQLPDRIWIAHPTLELLMNIAEDGYTAAPEIHDSYTATVACRFRRWAERIRDDRIEVIDRLLAAGITPDAFGKDPHYKAIKDGYAIAVQLFLGKSDQSEAKSPVYRPDWYHTVHAQHAASTWRRTYRAWRTGCSPARMGSVDEVSFTLTDWDDMEEMVTPPFILDPTGKKPGTVKIKDHYVVTEDSHATA